MDDDRTVIRPGTAGQEASDADRTVISTAALIQVRLLDAQSKITATFSFAQDFTAGRAQDNAIVIQNPLISRHHLAVKKEDGAWWIYNIKSTNGVFLHGKRVEHKAQLDFPALISLGASGIQLEIDKIEWGLKTHEKDAVRRSEPGRSLASNNGARDAKPDRSLSPEQIKARLLAEEEVEDAGDFTRIVRRLIREDRTKRGKSYKKVIWALGVLFVISAGLVAYQQTALSHARRLAIGMFYDIKTLEVSLSRADMRLEESAQVLEKTIKAVADEQLRVDRERIRAEQEKIAVEKRRLAQEMEKLKAMKAKYQQYVKEASSLRISFPTAAQYERELVVRVARGFGESELEVPEEFEVEVRKYIRYWQNSSRMQHAINNLEKNSYAPIVISALEKEGLPLQFLYLPLQESNYDNMAVGPETRYGIAKGAWQLLATTAQEYGLAIGPLAGIREFDEQDARFDFKLATRAGIRYLRRIYSTEAQASGLLVMASYNYGHNRVRAMIKEMPDNPREKNFWKFIQHYEIPRETYDYVFYIFSAAVIGEDPRHFGFRFKPPLLAEN